GAGRLLRPERLPRPALLQRGPADGGARGGGAQAGDRGDGRRRSEAPARRLDLHLRAARRRRFEAGDDRCDRRTGAGALRGGGAGAVDRTGGRRDGGDARTAGLEAPLAPQLPPRPALAAASAPEGPARGAPAPARADGPLALLR